MSSAENSEACSDARAGSRYAHWFMSLADAQEKLDASRRDYHEVRPHSAIEYNVPDAMHYPDGAASPPSLTSLKILASGGPKMGCSASTRGLSERLEQRRGSGQLHLRFDATPAVVSTSSSPDGMTEVFRCANARE